MLCDSCGSVGTHLACSGLMTPMDDWNCDVCTRVLRKSRFHHSLSLHRVICVICIITIIERNRLGWHKPKLRGRLTNVTKIHAFQSGKLREKSSVFSRRLKVDEELDERTSGDTVFVFQTRAAAVGRARSPTVDRFVVGTANVSNDHDRSRCLDGRSLMLRRSPDRYAGASPCRHRYTLSLIHI